MFLANENFPQPSILIIIKAGYVVQSIQEDFPGINDLKVIELAKQNNQTILTYDKDYGEIIFKFSIIEPPSILFFREKGNDPNFAGLTLLKLMNVYNLNLNGSFTVIEKNNIRQKFY